MGNLTGKRLLLQGASRGNLGLIKTAKSNGVYVVMTGLGGDFPCNPYADEFCRADIMDCDAVLKVAQEHHVDGAVICCSDTGLKAVGRCNDVMGLTGLTEKSAEESSNKFLMKQKLTDAGVRTAKFFKVSTLSSIHSIIDDIGFPIIIKAVDLQGSRGINVVRDKTALNDAFKDTMSLTRKDYCIVEQYIEGREYGAQAFVYKGEVLFVLPHGDETMMCKTMVPIGHFMPFEANEDLLKDTKLQVENSIKALGFNNCAVNVDLIERDGKAYIIELTGRVGANCLPELTGNYFGINYYEMILATCLGESPLPYWEKRKLPCTTLARVIHSEHDGICKSVSIPQIQDTQIQMFIHEGSEIRKFTNSNDAIGEVVVKGEDLSVCERKIQEAIRQIRIDFE